MYLGNPDPYGPPLHNPLTRGQKIAIGVGSAAVVGLGVFLLWPSSASAAVPPTTPSGGGGTKTPTNRPPGQPPGGDCNKPSQTYDFAFWDAGGETVARQRIFDYFQTLGYQTPTNRNTMNALGPNAELGGDDDVPNEEVRRFQKEYNAVSRQGTFLSGMGGLDRDGLVGPCTLNGIKYVVDNLGENDWQTLVDAADSAGFKAL
jgi:hypothetical protein